MSTPSNPSAEDFQRRLAARLDRMTAAPPAIAPQRWEYRRAAALLTTFDPSRLLRSAGDRPGGAVLHLVDDCVTRGPVSTPAWSLRPAVREAALASIPSPRAAADLLTANGITERTRGPEGIALAYLRGHGPARARLVADRRTDLTGLHDHVVAVRWLTLVPGVTGLPAEADLRSLLDRRRLLEPLRVLLRDGFEGRARELDRLRKFLGILPAATVRGRIADVHQSIADRWTEPLPMIVYGLGGIGKSTLVARCLLDHVDTVDVRFPFAYIDFQRVAVSVWEPTTLIEDMARQLAVQYPGQAAEFDRLRRSCRETARKQHEAGERVAELEELPTTRAVAGRDARHGFQVSARRAEADAATRLGRILTAATRAQTKDLDRFVVVLDSFEQAQYYASPILDRMWEIFRALSKAYPPTRVVIAGRAPVGHPRVPAGDLPTLALGELDAVAAAAFLRSRKVAPEVARALVERIGGNPLSLQLAAGVAARMSEEGDTAGDWVRTVPARRRQLFGSVDELLIPAVLYDRLLRHVHQDEVRALAHPGLVLRRITPEIIRTVLGPLCQVAVPDLAAARKLFGRLAKELDLVEQSAPEELRHRPDIRRVMLRLMEGDKPAEVRRVEQAAADFYATSGDARDRAEEIYHRLRLGGTYKELQPRWTPAAAKHLSDVEPELPRRGRSVLARLRRSSDQPAPPADEGERERAAARDVENLLAQGYAGDALAVLRKQQPFTPCSPLYPLLVETLLRMSALDEARRTLDEALDAPGHDCPENQLELLLLSAKVAVRMGAVQTADHDLRRAERVAAGLGRVLDAITAALQRVRLYRTTAGPPRDEADAALAEHVAALPDAGLAGAPVVLRSAAAEVGARRPAVLARVLDLVGLPERADRVLTVLGSALATAVPGQPAVETVVRDVCGPSSSAASSASIKRATNSSPPERATMSVSRNAPRSASAKPASARSPSA